MNTDEQELSSVDFVIRYAGSDAGRFAAAQLNAALRELKQLRKLHAPFAVTPDEMRAAWYDTHDRERQDETLEALNAILANRGAGRIGGDK